MSANNSKPDINSIEEQIKALSSEDRAALLSRLAPTVVFLWLFGGVIWVCCADQ
ncbi:hypothetical protein [Microcystis aeruginosa]|uniref:hypothetical protein n=1 Tax=Microcystis aeruginosa TaxID=1126 RepID=UPI001293CFB0|nr:hypothetical protein [Microcystis aeruginosa]